MRAMPAIAEARRARAHSMPTRDRVALPTQILRQVFLHLNGSLVRHGVHMGVDDFGRGASRQQARGNVQRSTRNAQLPTRVSGVEHFAAEEDRMITKEYDLEDRLTDPNLRRQRSHREEPQFERWAFHVERSALRWLPSRHPAGASRARVQALVHRPGNGILPPDAPRDRPPGYGRFLRLGRTARQSGVAR